MTVNRKSASQLVDAVVSVSEYVLTSHSEREYFCGVPSSIIYNIGSADTAALSPRSDPQDGLIFGYIGRLEDEKGIQVLLQATEYLSGSNWRLRIAGAGLDNYVKVLKRRFSDPRIEWLGFTEAKQFYASIDVTIVSSVWNEPLSRTVIETFASGKSAICALSGGIPEIANLGKVVATYPPRDARGLAAIMDRAMQDTELWRSGGFRDANSLDFFADASIVTRYRAMYQDKVTDRAMPEGSWGNLLQRSSTP
jgi:glycosyltransferase involved in cell wall biosynthesis